MTDDSEKYERAMLAQHMQRAYEGMINNPRMKLWRQIERGIVPADRLEEADQLMKEEMATLELEREYHEQLCAEPPKPVWLTKIEQEVWPIITAIEDEPRLLNCSNRSEAAALVKRLEEQARDRRAETEAHARCLEDLADHLKAVLLAQQRSDKND